MTVLFTFALGYEKKKNDKVERMTGKRQGNVLKYNLIAPRKSPDSVIFANELYFPIMVTFITKTGKYFLINWLVFENEWSEFWG